MSYLDGDFTKLFRSTNHRTPMNMSINFRKLLLGSSLTLLIAASVACSDLPSENVQSPTSEVVNETISSTVVTPTPLVRDSISSSPDLAPTPNNEQNQPANFDGSDDKSDGKSGDIPSGASEVTELTPSQIVAAQQDHLADLYEETVGSIVFIRVGSNVGGGSGSGFVWDKSGHIVTNFHVIQGATDVFVKFFDGREYRANIVAFDPDSDLAVIKIVDLEHDLEPIAIGSSGDLRPGDLAIALGNPFGEEFTMTTGIVSAVSRTLNSGFSAYQIPAVVQTDAAINPGNSGGPLLDMDGQVIGVNTQIRSDSRQNSGVGFAVPVDLVKRVVPSLINEGSYTYPLMGISGDEVSIQVREAAGLDGDVRGAIVATVSSGGPADTAGLLGDTGQRSSNGQLLTQNFDGDIIVSINGSAINSMNDLIGFLALNTAPGEEIVVGVLRNGVEISIPMELGARPSST